MKAAATYTRVSTAKQDEGDRTSLVEQASEIAKYCEANGLTITSQYQDIASGAERLRPGFTAMLDIARRGEIDAIVVWKSDRLFRGIGPAADVLDAIEAAPSPVQLHAVSDSIDRKTLGIYAAIAGMERENIRERMTLGKVGAAKLGLVPVGNLPFGYKRNADRKPEIVESEAEIVRRIYAESLAGRGAVKIATGLDMDGVETPRRFKHWYSSQVNRILRATVYAGTWGYADTGIQIPFPPVVSQETFDSAQIARKTRTRRSARNTRNFYLLQHVMTCSECGRGFGAQTRGIDGPRFYICAGVRTHKMDCRSPKYLPAKKLEGVIWREICNTLMNPKLIAQALDELRDDGPSNADITQIERDIKSAETERERAAYLFTSGKVDEKLYDKLDGTALDKLTALVDRLTALQASQAVRIDVDTLEAWCERVSGGLDTMTDTERQQLVRMVVDSLNIDSLVKTRFEEVPAISHI